MRKGDVVRRPFLEAPGLADCRQSPAGSRSRYRHRRRPPWGSNDEMGLERGAAKPPLSVPGRPLLRRNRSSPLFEPHASGRRIVARCEW